MSYSPTFGYDICARRVSSQIDVAERFDLSRWRVAGNGADMIRPDVMQAFVDTFAPAGFDASELPARATASPRRRWRSRSCRRARASSSSWSRRPCSPAAAPASATGRSAIARSSIAAGRCADMEVAIRGDDGSVARRARDRQGLLPRHLGHGRLFPRRGGDRRLPRRRRLARHRRHGLSCRTAISTSSAAPRT